MESSISSHIDKLVIFGQCYPYSPLSYAEASCNPSGKGILSTLRSLKRWPRLISRTVLTHCLDSACQPRSQLLIRYRVLFLYFLGCVCHHLFSWEQKADMIHQQEDLGPNKADQLKVFWLQYITSGRCCNPCWEDCSRIARVMTWKRTEHEEYLASTSEWTG